ncbi:polysaccharide biosynthesis/export family protein [Neptunomonas sp.]|uniref:polysaccharide biosynthesis/export family protein n=1 Tax=Neptunomonas sp. TaxID=1971898 RepID=UPI0025FB4C37|nr:polysaccharide biosynthesis/export family protein [Neptunomonas sp.]
MWHRVCCLLCLFVFSQFSYSADVLQVAESARSEGLSDYRLGSGDLLGIKVFGEDDLSVEVRMSDAGTISYPFLGELRVKGLTTGALGDMLATQLRDGYLVNPSVSVTVLEYREFYINGAVKKPGAYPYQPGLTLQRAVSMAGGFTERASSSKFYLAHEKSASDIKPDKVKLNARIVPGDVITIKESFF